MLNSWDWGTETIDDVERRISDPKYQIEDIASRGTFRSIEVDDADLAQLLNVEKDTETETGTAQMQCDNQDTNIVSTNDSIRTSDVSDGRPRNMADQMQCKLLKDEGFDSVEDLESNIADIRQKLDTATTKKQDMLIKSLSQKLANRERLQEEITGRAPLA